MVCSCYRFIYLDNHFIHFVGCQCSSNHVWHFFQGFVHIALQSGLPIVPMVLTGTHLAWRKGSLHVRPAPLTVKYLPPIKTQDWTDDKVDEYVKTVHSLYVEELPESQKPLTSIWRKRLHNYKFTTVDLFWVNSCMLYSLVDEK